MKKGDIVLIPFPFTDLAGVKSRPALILATSEEIIIVSFITSQLKWQDEYSISLEPTEYNGLKRPSVLRLAKIATLDKNLAIGKIGILTLIDFQKVYEKLILMFKPD